MNNVNTMNLYQSVKISIKCNIEHGQKWRYTDGADCRTEKSRQANQAAEQTSISCHYIQNPVVQNPSIAKLFFSNKLSVGPKGYQDDKAEIEIDDEDQLIL